MKKYTIICTIFTSLLLWLNASARAWGTDEPPIYLVYPIFEQKDSIYKCYVIDEAWKYYKDVPWWNNPEEECRKINGKLVQELKVTSSNWSGDSTASNLLKTYFWRIISISIKFWMALCVCLLIYSWIMISSSWDKADTSWKKKLQWAIAAIFVLIMAGVILHTINPLFFTL